MTFVPFRGRPTLKKPLIAAAVIAAGCTAFSACATGTFTVTPVRIFMAPRDRAVAVTVTNEGDDELVMQADVYSWKQKPDGSDDLALSDDLILSPPILKIPGKSKQVVRLAMVSPPQPTQQLTYRLIVREIPEAHAGDRKVQLQVALAFSMPIFITPPGAKRDLACTVARSAADAVTASCSNSGTAYAQPRDFTLLGAGGDKILGPEGGGYILPGITRSFVLKRPEGAIPAGPAKLAVNFDDGTSQTYDVTVGQ